MKIMKLGYFLTGFGHHVASSRHPDALAHGGMNLTKTIEQAKLLEQAKFDFLFMSDSLYLDEKTHPDMFTFFEPISLMSIIARNKASWFDRDRFYFIFRAIQLS